MSRALRETAADRPAPPPRGLASIAARPDGRRLRLALAASVAGHLWIPFAMMAAQDDAPELRLVEPEPIPVSLVRPLPPPQPPPDAPEPDEPAPPSNAAPAPPAPPTPLPPPKVRHTPAPPETTPLMVATAAEPEPIASLSGAQLAGARTAGSGSGGDGSGRGCDMVQRIEDALRRDPEVRTAIAAAHRGVRGADAAILVWNGDWIRSPGQDGKGLAGVRQAIAMEVAFAPEACREEAVQGLVLFSMSDGPGAARLALGSGRWRWTDLLTAGAGRAGGAFPRRGG